MKALVVVADERIRKMEAGLMLMNSANRSVKEEGNDGDYDEFAIEKASANNWNGMNTDDDNCYQKNLITLRRLNLVVKANSFVTIIGGVGSGKSSLISTLVGDMRLVYGSVAMQGSIAYSAQSPFILNATIRDNILFGLPFIEDKYHLVLYQCALVTDLQILPAGDMTEIGERGINLSGGQKARVSLARAMYSDADIYLLDDPLAAVDAHVAKHLLENCLLRLQESGKCVILVTSALHILKYSSSILIMDNGAIIENGKFDNLSKNSQLFNDLLTNYIIDMGSLHNLDDESNGNNGDNIETTMSNISRSDYIDEKEFVDRDQNVTAKSECHSNNSIQSQSQQNGKILKNQTATTVPIEKDEKGYEAHINKSHSSNGNEVEKNKFDENVIQEQSKQIKIEEREFGDVRSEVYLNWMHAAGGYQTASLLLILFAVGEGISIFSSCWLSYWAHESKGGNLHQKKSETYFLLYFSLINIIVAIVLGGRELYLRLRCWSAGKMIFKSLLNCLMFAPMSFYDTVPHGRVLNRLGKDMYTIDEQLAQTSRWYLQSMAKVLGVLLYIVIVTPLFIIGLLPICLFYIAAQKYYIKTCRELTRLDSILRSPIYAIFHETLSGLSTVRAFRYEKALTKKIFECLDSQQQAYFLKFSCNCWLAVRLELIGTFIITVAALCAVLGKGYDRSTYDPDGNQSMKLAYLGLGISLALSVTQSLNWSVRMASELESQMVAMERITEFSQMERETDSTTIVADNESSTGINPLINMARSANSNNGNNGNNKDSDVSVVDDPNLDVCVGTKNSWPSMGSIEFVNLSMRYRDGLPLVLKGINLRISAGEKVGIVGRTGSGKTSLLSALLRLVEADHMYGAITIDNVDIATVALQVLRSRLSVIAQDPILFSGNLRSNLDPDEEFLDEECYSVLKSCQLPVELQNLNYSIEENGSNLSLGQRQLISIARAILQKSKIVVIDEATSFIDNETDDKIQRVIMEEFKMSTVITIAHRLNTIMKSERILVLDDGEVKEFDTPSILLQQTDSFFSALVKTWGETHTNDNIK